MLVGMVNGQDRLPVGRAVAWIIRRLMVGPRPVMVVIVVAVLMVVVLVVADVEVDMEEAGAELTVVVPIAGSVESKPGKAGEDDEDHRRRRRPRRSGQHSMESSHHEIPR